MGTLTKLALRREPAIIRTLFFAAPLAALLVPKTTVGVVLALFLCCVGLALAHGHSLRSLIRTDAALALFGATAIYLFVNATWSLDHERACSSAAWFVVIVLTTYAACGALAKWPRASLQMAATAFLIAVGVAAAILAFEAATGRAGTLFLYNALPVTQPASLKGFVVRNGDVMRIRPSELNANIGVLLLCLWPALLCLMGRLSGKTKLWCVGALLFIATAAIFLSDHDSSKTGLVFSALVFAVAAVWPNGTRRGMCLTWCLAFALVVPLAITAYKAELNESGWLPASAQARITLWAYTAEHVSAAPILGIGASSTRSIDQSKENRENKWRQKWKSQGFGWRAGAHAHNVFLQSWYELGAIGVLLFVLTGSAVILSLKRLPAATQRYALAHVAAFFSIIAFAWGMWQGWLIALVGLSAMYVALAVNLERSREEIQPPAGP